jgi:ribosome maturation factor RimP
MTKPMDRENEFRKEIHRLIEPVVRGMGLTLWGIEHGAAGRRRLIRIYIDSPQGVGVDKCAELSRHVGVVLEIEDLIPGPYVLEVSSPGLERPFFDPSQLERYVGREIRIQLDEPVQGRKNWRGELRSVKGTVLRLLVNGQDVEFQWERIRKARLVCTDFSPR